MTMHLLKSNVVPVPSTNKSSDRKTGPAWLRNTESHYHITFFGKIKTLFSNHFHFSNTKRLGLSSFNLYYSLRYKDEFPVGIGNCYPLSNPQNKGISKTLFLTSSKAWTKLNGCDFWVLSRYYMHYHYYYHCAHSNFHFVIIFIAIILLLPLSLS